MILACALGHFDLVVPGPASSRAISERGFKSSRLLSREILGKK